MNKKDIKCKWCDSPNWIEAGWGFRGGKQQAHRRRCKDCGKIFTLDKNEKRKNTEV